MYFREDELFRCVWPFCENCNFIKKEPLARVISCEFWENLKNTFFTEHLRTIAFD